MTDLSAKREELKHLVEHSRAMQKAVDASITACVESPEDAERILAVILCHALNAEAQRRLDAALTDLRHHGHA